MTASQLVGVRFGGAAIGLASQILLARLMPQAEVGVIFLGMSAAAIVSQLVSGGYPMLAFTWLPRYHALGRKVLVDAFHAAFWHDATILMALAAVAGVVVLATVPIDAGLRTAVIFGLLAAPGAALIRINSATANSLRRFTISYVPDFLLRPGLLLVFLATAWLTTITLTVDRVLWAFVASMYGVALVQALLMGRTGAIPPPFATAKRNHAAQLRSRAASLIVVGLVAGSFADLVNMIGGAYLASDQVAELGVAIRLAALVGFITQATQNFVLPDLAKALTRGDRLEARALLMRINVIALSAIGACVLITMVFGGAILAIFGAEYADAAWPLVLFMVGQGLRAASGMNQHLLSLGGFQARTAGACLVAVVTLFAGAALLVPHYGVMGMAVAAVAADLIWAILLAAQAQRFAGRRGDVLALLRAPA